MERDIMKIILGIFFMGILPVLFVCLQKKWGYLWEREIQRRIIYLLCLGNICGVLLGMGNMEMAFSVLMGSTMFHFLVVQGISLIHSREGSQYLFSKQKINGLEWFAQRRKIFMEKMDGSSVFLVISYILLLLLCADYLFGQRQVQNVLGRGDGCVLAVAGLLYFFLEGRRFGWVFLMDRIRDSFRDNLWKKIGFLLGLEACILLGSYFLIDGVLFISVHSSILPYTIGFLFLSWCVNFVNIDFSSCGEQSFENANNQESIFSITILLGLCAIYRSIYISIFQVYDLIIFSVISFILILPIKIDSRFLGCCRVTAYFALVLYILFR